MDEFKDLIFDFDYFKNVLIITDDMINDKSRTEDIDKIKFFQYLEIKYRNSFFNGLRNSFHIYSDVFIEQENIDEKIKTLELELTHVFENKEKCKEYYQSYIIWKLLQHDFYDIEDLVADVQRILNTILIDISKDVKIKLWQDVVDKFVQRKILENSVHKKINGEINKFKKNMKKKSKKG